MEPLNFDELQDRVKLATVLGNEMVALANAVRDSATAKHVVADRMERCLLLAGFAAGMLLREDYE